MGRPKKEIDQEQFEKLCEMQCTQEEICNWYNVTDKTLTKWCKETYGAAFSEVFKQKRGRGKISLRRIQWQLAQNSVPMAIWLGKQYLNQREQVDTAPPEASKSDDALSASLKELAEAIDKKAK